MPNYFEWKQLKQKSTWALSQVAEVSFLRENNIRAYIIQLEAEIDRLNNGKRSAIGLKGALLETLPDGEYRLTDQKGNWYYTFDQRDVNAMYINNRGTYRLSGNPPFYIQTDLATCRRLCRRIRENFSDQFLQVALELRKSKIDLV